MTPKHFRNLSLFCCATAIVVAALGLYQFYLRVEWFAELGGLEATAPETTIKALYVAGLLMALGGCFQLKARAHEDRANRRPEPVEMSDEG